ncbi:MAG: MFS transporter [Jatrophihabitantaceae bacterium]
MVGISNRGDRRIPLALAVVVAAVFMTNLDLWIVNVALPSIGTGFGHAGRPSSLPALSWVLNAYAVGLAALLIVAGRLGDRIGHRQVFLVGVCTFTVASALCAIAPSLPVLVAARVLQAAGAAAQLPTSLALLMAAVPAERRTVIARGWAAVGALAAASGPVLGGLLVGWSWRWIFLVNVPIGLASVLVGLRVLPRPPARQREPLPDLLGAALVTVAVAALTGALVQASSWGWRSPAILALLGLTGLAGAGFVRRCATHRHPLFELSLLRIRGFGLANAATFTFSVGFSIMLLSNVLWCQQLWHYSPLRTGLAMLPGPALVPVVTVLSSRAVHRFGSGPLAAAGSACFALAMLWRVAVVSVQPNYLLDLLPSMVLGGIGVGLALGTLIAAGVTALPAHRSATGSAMVNVGRQVAAAVGVAVLVSLLGNRLAAADLTGFRTAWTVAAALSGLAGLLAAWLPKPVPAESVPAHPTEPIPANLAEHSTFAVVAVARPVPGIGSEAP